MQLICFTYAGGTSELYGNIQIELKDMIDVIAIDYQGHGNRRKERLNTDIDSLSEDMLNQIMAKCNIEEPFAFMGYSMGSIVAIAVYELMKKRGYKLPIHIFLAAHFPETNKRYLDYMDEKMDEEIKKHIAEFGGIPSNLMNNDAFWRIYIPIYKADFHTIGTYNFEDRKPIVKTPVTFFYSESDTPLKKLKKWEDYFELGCDFFCYEGNHFFIKDNYKEISAIIKYKIGV